MPRCAPRRRAASAGLPRRAAQGLGRGRSRGAHAARIANGRFVRWVQVSLSGAQPPRRWRAAADRWLSEAAGLEAQLTLVEADGAAARARDEPPLAQSAARARAGRALSPLQRRRLSS
jgi:hypothetical protein